MQKLLTNRVKKVKLKNVENAAGILPKRCHNINGGVSLPLYTIRRDV